MKKLAIESYVLAHLGFWVSVTVIVVMGYTLYDATIKMNESLAWVTHTQEVLQTINQINEQLARGESAQRGYLLSGAEAFLSKRDQELAKMKDAALRLQSLTADNPVQLERTSRLEKLIAQRIAIMQENARLRRAEGIEVATRRAASGVGQLASTTIYELTAQMEQEEQRLLGWRRINEQHRHQVTLDILVVAVLVSVIVLIPGYIGFVIQARARASAERKLLEMAESLPGAVYQYRSNPDGSARFEFLSSGVAQVRGFDREAALRDASVLWDSIVDDDKAAFSAAMRKAAQTVTPLQHDYRVKRPDGAIQWIRTSASLSQEADGSILWNGYWSDITEQKRLERELQASKDAAELASRAKSSFLATMSHEIRTPMNGMLGMLELLSMTQLDADQRTTLEVVRESGKSLQRIIDDILDFSKIEAGRLEIRPEVAAIKEIIEGVHNIYSGNASSKGLLLRHSIDPHISPALWVDSLRLGQILNNFVSNAIKFTSEGAIEIKAELVERRDGEDRVQFFVRDTGIGIPPENLERLFQPFIQGESDTTRRFGGSGLGLTICRRLADLMGGSIEMVSEPGKGTTVMLSLFLPIADPKDLPKAATAANTRELLSTTLSTRRKAPTVTQAQAEGTLVLVVDDHPTNRLVLLRQVNTLGYAAESAENGAEALRLWRSGRFAAVVTDCNMPEMDGYELARNIRKLESADGGKRSPIIACTANALGGEAEICFAAGMDDYLAKPVALKDLLKKLDRWLPIPEAEATPAEAPAAAPVERSVLAAISGGDAAAESCILRDFRRINEGDATMLKDAVEKNDIPQIIRASHRIKGASRMVGALGLAAVCERIERAGRANDCNTVMASMDSFHQEMQRLSIYLDSL